MASQIADVIKCSYGNKYKVVLQKYLYGIVNRLSACQNDVLINSLLDHKMASSTCTDKTVPEYTYHKKYGVTVNKIVETVPLLDDESPVLVSTTPSTGYSGISVSQWTVSFNENVIPQSGLIQFYDYDTDTLLDSVMASSGTGSGSTYTYNVSSVFTGDSHVYVLIASNAFMDEAGNYFTGITNKDTLEYTFTGSAPEAQNVTLTYSGVLSEGTTLTIGYTFYDADGDLEGNTTIELIQYDDNIGTNPQTVYSTNPLGSPIYVVPAGKQGKYYQARITPLSATGTNPGNTVYSNKVGAVVQEVLNYSTTKTGTHSVSITLTSNANITIQWETGLVESFINHPSGSSVITHVYPSSASKNVIVYIDNGTKLTSINLDSQNLTGVLYCKNLTNLTGIRAALNSSLTYINMSTCSGTLTQFVANGCNFSTALNFTGFTFNGLLNLDSLGAMPMPLNLNGSFSQLILKGNIVNLDLSGISIKNNGSITVQNSNLTSFVAPTYEGVLASINLQFNYTFTGTINLGAAVFSNSNIYLGYMNISDVDMSLCSGSIRDFRTRTTLVKNVVTGFSNITLTSNASAYLTDCAMTSTNVDDWLTAIEARLPVSPTALTGTIDISGTNAAPTGTGATIAANLALRGATVLTS